MQREKNRSQFAARLCASLFSVLCVCVAHPSADTDEVHHRAANVDTFPDDLETPSEPASLEDPSPCVGRHFGTARVCVDSRLHDGDLCRETEAR